MAPKKPAKSKKQAAKAKPAPARAAKPAAKAAAPAKVAAAHVHHGHHHHAHGGEKACCGTLSVWCCSSGGKIVTGLLGAAAGLGIGYLLVTLLAG